MSLSHQEIFNNFRAFYELSLHLCSNSRIVVFNSEASSTKLLEGFTKSKERIIRLLRSAFESNILLLSKVCPLGICSFGSPQIARFILYSTLIPFGIKSAFI